MSAPNFSYKEFFYFILPAVLWWVYCKLHKKYKGIEIEQSVFMQKHNCVVMYHKGKGMSGWPPYPGFLPLTNETIVKFTEPLCYFIDTAEKTLEIAVFNIKLQEVIWCLKNALNRGVAIRIILHQFNRDIKNLERRGAQILAPLPNANFRGMMNLKYAVKDNSSKKGCCVFGSLNWRMEGILFNFENLVFSTEPNMVSSLTENFNEMWMAIAENNMNHGY